MNRPMCRQCKLRPRAINYKKGKKVYYRSMCDSCIRIQKGNRIAMPNWTRDGYKKKTTCDLCGFKARWSAQLAVYYVDGNMNNTTLSNLKTICLNCGIGIEKQDMLWKAELDIKADF